MSRRLHVVQRKRKIQKNVCERERARQTESREEGREKGRRMNIHRERQTRPQRSKGGQLFNRRVEDFMLYRERGRYRKMCV